MRRMAVVTVGGVLALAMAVPVLANPAPRRDDPLRPAVRPQAVTTQEHAPERPRPSEPPERTESLRLACRGTEADGRPAIGCRWSAAAHPGFAAYRLWRGGDGARRVVFRSTVASETTFVDSRVRPGQVYVYAVEVVNRSGERIGFGGPVRAEAPQPQAQDRPERRRPTEPPPTRPEREPSTGPRSAGR